MSNLNDFVIENGVLKEYKGKEEHVVIPEGVTEIGRDAFPSNMFKGYSSIKSLVIPEGVTKIGENAVSSNKVLETVSLPESLIEIKSSAFSGCASLKEINFPKSLNTIGSAAFSGCEALVSIVIPDNIKHLEQSTFARCTSLVSVSIPQKLQMMPPHVAVQGVFAGCTSFSTIDAPWLEKDNEMVWSNFQDCPCRSIVTVKNAKEKMAIAYYYLTHSTEPRVDSDDIIAYMKRSRAKLLAYIIEQGNTEAFNGFVNLLNDKKIKAADLDMYIVAAKNNEVLTEALLEYKNTNYLA